jgi:hypothetical protein
MLNVNTGIYPSIWLCFRTCSRSKKITVYQDGVDDVVGGGLLTWDELEFHKGGSLQVPASRKVQTTEAARRIKQSKLTCLTLLHGNKGEKQVRISPHFWNT